MLDLLVWITKFLSVIPTIVLGASLIAALTPTPVDDGWLKKISKLSIGVR